MDRHINTSNQGKLKEFERLFAKYGITLKATKQDLREIDADPVTVVVHKASGLEAGIIVEDTSLEIEGESIGVNVRWLLDYLSHHLGKKAVWKTLLAYEKDGRIYVFEGVVHGTLIFPRGEDGFGFDPYFLPDGSTQTLAEAKPDEVNARAKAVEALVHKRPLCAVDPITEWEGLWQEH